MSSGSDAGGYSIHFCGFEADAWLSLPRRLQWRRTWTAERVDFRIA